MLICIVNMVYGNTRAFIIPCAFTYFRKVRYTHFRIGHRMSKNYRLYSPFEADTADISIFNLTVCIRLLLSNMLRGCHSK